MEVAIEVVTAAVDTEEAITIGDMGWAIRAVKVETGTVVADSADVTS